MEIKLKCFNGAPCGVEKDFNDWMYDISKRGSVRIMHTNQSFMSGPNGVSVAYSVMYEFTPNNKPLEKLNNRLLI